MPDDLNRRAPEDSKRINVNEPWELNYWSKKLGISEQNLKRLVAQYGTSVEVIRLQVMASKS